MTNPEYSQPQDPGYGVPAPAVAPKGLAITGFVLGLVAFVFGFLPVVGLLVGIAAIIVSGIALSKKQHKVFSLIGLIAGILGTVWGVIVLISLIAVLSNPELAEQVNRAAAYAVL